MAIKKTHPGSIICPHCGVKNTYDASGGSASVEFCSICKQKITAEVIDESEKPRFVTIYQPDDEQNLIKAEALLNDLGIEYFTKNYYIEPERVLKTNDLNYRLVYAPTQIQVPQAIAEETRLLLDIYFAGTNSKRTFFQRISENETPLQQEINRSAVKALLFCLIWLGGLGASFAIYHSLKALSLIYASEKEPFYGKSLIFLILTGACMEIAITPFIWLQILGIQ
jgi:hypothetical protein